jgi:hypothetical protein
VFTDFNLKFCSKFVLFTLIIVDYLSDRLSVTKRRITYFLTVPISIGRYCGTNRKVAGSIPDGVIAIFY